MLTREGSPGRGGHEHAETPAFEQDSAVHQQIKTLRSPGRIDPTEGHELIAGWGALTFSQGAVQDGGLQLFGDLHEECATLFHEPGQRDVCQLPAPAPGRPAAGGHRIKA
ncbi:hypothetical protein BG28_12330 [Nesterenkonia sp. AN1]|nr:hypothetical protein BG28_12330 [Nesterenkonia sp. AN1]